MPPHSILGTVGDANRLREEALDAEYRRGWNNALEYAAKQLEMSWRPINDPPKDGVTVLGFWVNGEMHTGQVWRNEWVAPFRDKERWDMPTHWMPVPMPPKQEN